MDSYQELYSVLKESVYFFNHEYTSTTSFYSSFITFLEEACSCSAAAICELEYNTIHLRNELNIRPELYVLLDNKSIYDYPYASVFSGGQSILLKESGFPDGAMIIPIKNRYFVYGAFFVVLEKMDYIHESVELFDAISVHVAGVIEGLQKNYEPITVHRVSAYFTEDKVDFVLNALPDPFFIKDTSGKYIACNRAFCSFLGRGKDEIIGNRIYDVSPYGEVGRHHDTDFEVLNSQRCNTYESEYRTPDGTIHNVVITKNVFYNNEGEPDGIVGSIRDVTQLVTVQKQYEHKNNELMRINTVLLNSQKDIIDYNKRLTESEEKYRLLIENQQEFIVKIDVLGEILFRSQSMTNFMPPDLLKNSSLRFQDLLFGSDKSVFETILRESALFDREHEVEFRMRSEQNTINRISWSFKPVFSGREIEYVIGVGRDVTARWSAEQELANFRLLLEAAFEQSPSASILIKYPEKNIMIINNAAQRFLQLPQDNYVGLNVDELLRLKKAYIADSGTDIYEALSSEKIYHETHSSLEFRCPDENGFERTALLYSTPIYNNIGELISYLLIFPEITELREAEKRIEEQNNELQKIHKLESIGVLAGGIAHDFNNILGAVLGNLSLVRMYDPGEKVNSIIFKAEKAVGRAKELTNQLLTFSKGGAPVRKSAHLNEIIRDSAMFTLHGSRVDIDFSLDHNLLPGLVDSGQISQVVQNLVINGVQAMPEGGTISIKTENVEVSDPALPLLAGKYIKLTVSDTGHGIPRDIQDRIFDPFFTTKAEGNGLGLATSYNIVKNHEGYITLESSTEGTSFYIYLPVSDCQPQSVKDSSHHKQNYNGTVLIMDDEEAIQDVASSIFTLLGFTALAASDGEAAVEKSKKRIESGEPIDLYVLDLTVPGGMGGEEAIELLKEISPKAYFVVSSGYANNRTMSHYRDHGFSGILEKPYTIGDVRKLLKEILYETASHTDE